MKTISMLLLLLVAPAMFGQTSELRHFVRASAEAVTTVKPDCAEISLGVVSSSPTAVVASSQNASATARVLESLKRVVGSKGSIQTSGYALSPEYKFEQGQAPQITSYRASNTVLVTLDDLSMVGKVIDAATAAGSNTVDGIAFTLRNQEPARAQVLAQAAKQARINAETIANALGLTVVGVLQAEPKEAPEMRPVLMQAKAFSAGARTPTPVEAGNLEIRADVTVTLEVR